MKNKLACALLTIGIVSFNATPAKAISSKVEIKKSQMTNNVEVCFYVPWWGEVCFG